MEKSNVSNKHTTRYIVLTAIVVVLTVVFLVGRPQTALADKIIVPAVPDNLKVQDGAKVFLVGHAVGTQNYICLPTGSGVAWSLFTPQATLFDDTHEQIITHFFSPNPETGIIRATWQHSHDTSTIWAALAPDGASSDPQFVALGAIPWLLLNVEKFRDGPTGGDKLSDTIQVQRLNTSGGVAPATDCASLTDVGRKAFVPYTADYFFYKK